MNEDVNAIARDLQTLHDTAQMWRDLAQEWKESKDPKLGKVKDNGRSGGSAAPKKDRKAMDKEKNKEEEPCICENLYAVGDVQVVRQGQGEGECQGQ